MLAFAYGNSFLAGVAGTWLSTDCSSLQLQWLLKLF
jgi:hypothetical protein